MQRRLIYEGRVFKLYKDQFELNGKLLERDVVVHPGAVAILVENEGKFLFVKQYRHPTGKYLLEIPAGTLEKNETPEETAMRELMEEAGIKPLNLKKLTSFFVAPGYTSEIIHLFYTDEFEYEKLEGDEDEDISVIWLNKETAFSMVKSSEIEDAKTIIALMFYRCFFL